MRSSSRWLMAATILISISALGLSGCATRKWVRQTVTTVEEKVNEQGTQITRHEGTLREHGERIDAVDRRAQQGISAAQTADQKAGAADQKATDAGRRADQANQGVTAANGRITTLEGRIANIGAVNACGTPATVNFDTDKYNLSDQARSALDGIAGQATGQRGGYYVEIRGFTDDRGSESYNFGLSQRRAQAVQRYLVSKNVALYRTEIVGLGEENPVADNKTRPGRDQNRRVEVRMFCVAAP